MGHLTKSDSALLDKLVSDCITYSLKPKESLEYIGKEYRVIDERTYFRRRKRLLSEETTNKWYSYFTRIGFVVLHKKLIDGLQSLLDDSLKRLHEEKQKPEEKRDDYLIVKLNKDIKETTLMLAQFSFDSPIIAAMEYKLSGRVYGIESHYKYDYNNKYFRNNYKSNNELPSSFCQEQGQEQDQEQGVL